MKLVQFAVRNSVFYQNLYHDIKLNELKLEQLPVLSKQVMMANWDQIVTDKRLKRSEIAKFFAVPSNVGKLFRKRFIIVHTSGTTGEKAIVAYRKADLDIVEALSIARGNHVPLDFLSLFKQIWKLRIRFAAILMIHGHYTASTSLYHTYSHNIFMKFKLFSILLPMEKLVQELNAYQPKIIATYATILEGLACEQLKGNLKIKLDAPFSLLGSFSETLTPKARALVKKAFNFDVENTYGASECLEIARDCTAHELHIHSDYVILESVDEMNRPVPFGQMGSKVLLTNLFNFAHPLIRYEISDMITISNEPCACGSSFPFIKEIGRVHDDVFYLLNEKGSLEEVNPIQFDAFVVNLENVRQGQVVQEAYDKILLRLVPNDSVKLDIPEIVKKMKHLLKNLNLTPKIDVKVEILSDIPRNLKTGKFKAILRNVPAPDLSLKPKCGTS